MTEAGSLSEGPYLVREASRLAEVCTEALYREKPELEALGARGREHTRNDFGYHFVALADLSAERFREHVEYCVGLFQARGFPLSWLDDAWRHMATGLVRETGPEVSGPALEVMRLAGVSIER